jgi:hypothetical protein
MAANSIKGKIYQYLVTHLMTELSDAKMTAIGLPKGVQWIDKNKGQLENLDEEHPIPMPCILISFGRSEYITRGVGTQQGDMRIEITIGYESFSDSDGLSMDQDKAIEMWEFNDQVFMAMQGLSADLFSNMDRATEQDDINHDTILKTVQEYRCRVIDESAFAHRKYVDATVALDLRKNLMKPGEETVVPEKPATPYQIP